jgi:hypothetical protein
MPYVIQDKRSKLNDVVYTMAAADIKADGDLNYVLFKYCKDYITPSYNNYKNFLGELNECAEEIRRRLLSKYEDKKIEENGDV